MGREQFSDKAGKTWSGGEELADSQWRKLQPLEDRGWGYKHWMVETPSYFLAHSKETLSALSLQLVSYET